MLAWLLSTTSSLITVHACLAINGQSSQPKQLHRCWPQGTAAAMGLSGAPLWQGLPDKPTSLTWHPSLPALLAIGCENGAVGVFDVEAGSSAFSAARHAAPVVSMVWQISRPEGLKSRVVGEAESAQVTARDPESMPPLLTLGGDGQVLSWGVLGAVAQQALQANAGGSATATAALPAPDPLHFAWTKEPGLADTRGGQRFSCISPAEAAAAEQVTALSTHIMQPLLALGLSDGRVGVCHSVDHKWTMPDCWYHHAGAVSSLQWCPAAASAVHGSGNGALPLLASAGVDGSIACAYGEDPLLWRAAGAHSALLKRGEGSARASHL